MKIILITENNISKILNSITLDIETEHSYIKNMDWRGGAKCQNVYLACTSAWFKFNAWYYLAPKTLQIEDPSSTTLLGLRTEPTGPGSWNVLPLEQLMETQDLPINQLSKEMDLDNGASGSIPGTK